MRNEAHRFGITHHRNKRSKSALTSVLDEILGIGPQTKTQLLERFKTVSRISKTSEEELSAVIGPSRARLILNHFKK